MGVFPRQRLNGVEMISDPSVKAGGTVGAPKPLSKGPRRRNKGKSPVVRDASPSAPIRGRGADAAQDAKALDAPRSTEGLRSVSPCPSPCASNDSLGSILDEGQMELEASGSHPI